MIVYYALLFGFIILMVSVMVFMGIAGSNAEQKDEFRSKLWTIGLITFALIAVLFGLTTIYIESFPDYFRSYSLLMIHLNLFFSILAVSIASLTQA